MKRGISYGVIGFVLGVLAWVVIGRVAPDVGAAKSAPCIGCSVDGKTTPRMPDGHPDLNGFWGGGGGGGGAAAEGGRGSVFQKSADGSILFDIGTEFNVRKLCHD